MTLLFLEYYIGAGIAFLRETSPPYNMWTAISACDWNAYAYFIANLAIVMAGSNFCNIAEKYKKTL